MLPDDFASIRLYNDPATIDVSNKTTQEFINEIHDQLEAGFGFVPFIGAGLSAPSGIPLIWEIESYLRYCIALALGIIKGDRPYWNPRTDQWPPFRTRVAKTDVEWMNLVRNAMDTLPSARSSDRRVFHEALGALAEWRTSLLFLARVMPETRGAGRTKNTIFVLDAPKQVVIDAGLREIMRGKLPTLGHRMLAALGGVLRLDVILTTNFDDLLEQAFVAVRNPLTVFGLHLASDLPDYAAISAQRSLIKLHGDRHSLRADYTLDALPDNSDLWRFLDYLLTADGHNRVREGKVTRHDFDVASHLLVMGFSANERRTRAFIEHAWLHTHDRFSVFWLCHTEKDVHNVARFTNEVSQKLDKGRIWNKDRSRVLRHTNLGLFFLHLFQSVRHSIPIKGVIFPSASRLALPPIFSEYRLSPTSASKTLLASIRNRVNTFSAPSHDEHRLVVATSTPQAHGLTSVCSEAFDVLQEEGYCCLWLEMNGVSSADDLFEQLLDAAHYSTGTENWSPVFVESDPRSRANELRRIIVETARPWIIFLNARETPGANLDPPDSARKKKPPMHPLPNGWLDQPKPSDDIDESATTNSFLELLTEICGPLQQTSSGAPILHPAAKCTVVLMTSCIADPRDPLASEPHGAPLNAALLKHALVDQLDVLTDTCISFKPPALPQKCLQWVVQFKNHRYSLPEARVRLRFLATLVQMQCTRFISSVWSDALGFEESSNSALPLEWLNELETIGLVRRKLGGFVWLRAASRNELREAFLDDGVFNASLTDTLANDPDIKLKSLKKPFLGLTIVDSLADIHWRLAQWYRRILSAVETPTPLFEAVYHALKSAVANLRSGTNPAVALRRLGWATSLIQSHGFMIQTRGYSRGSCRRLEDIRLRRLLDVDDLVSQLPPGPAKRRLMDASVVLSLKCMELMRAIAREVGENRKAYVRLREATWQMIHSIPQLPSVELAKRARELSEQQKGGLLLEMMTRCYSSAQTNSNTVPFDPLVEWLRFCRWQGMLGVASRSYEKGLHSVLRGLASVSWTVSTGIASVPTYNMFKVGDDIDLKKVDAGLSSMIQVFRNNSLGSRSQPIMWNRRLRDTGMLAVVAELIRLGEQFVDGVLLDHNIRRRLRRMKRSPGGQLLHAELLQDVVSRLLGFVELGIASSSDAHSPSYAALMWCRHRLLLHESICHVAASAPSFAKAMQSLTDAEACLSLIDVRRFGSDRAIVELFRAEVRLREAEAVSVVLNTTKTLTIAEIPDEFTIRPTDATLWHTKGSVEKANVFGQTFDASWSSKVKALLRDALRFLDRAEAVLSQRRRNVSWTTWYIQRRMRAIAGLLWATITDNGAPIPYLGPEAAPADGPTVADELLDDAIRMIRQDPYRLATIIDSYTSCARAFHVRLLIDPLTPRMPMRQIAIRDSLQRANERLDSMMKERVPSPAATTRSKHSDELDKNVETYINAVIASAALTVSELASPFN